MTIIVVGEGMIELAPAGEARAWTLAYGGDTLNTAIHLARLGHDVGFLSALGSDPFSDDLRAAWVGEGLRPEYLLTDPARRPGLYAISNDHRGERHFTYWRSDSAARQVFALPDSAGAIAAAARADLLVFSMISLAILPSAGRAALLDLARAVRTNGGRVAFDTNFRPALWPDLEAACAAYRDALAVSDIGLPTLEDEEALTGVAAADTIVDGWMRAGVGEVALKRGADGCLVDRTLVPPAAVLSPVDTSGAGDAFNAGYLHARLNHHAPLAAARAGHELAGWVVMQRGAIPDLTAEAPYALMTGRTNMDRPSSSR
ncbi:sugar kinase [Sphingomonas sp.]|uniref:sugar kinase n=1 Tax=Sphingomonas sp. TaxID=28214 RepID=UPI0035C874E0